MNKKALSEIQNRGPIEEENAQVRKDVPGGLWIEFGRLTGWKGSVIQRPKYWGKLACD